MSSTGIEKHRSWIRVDHECTNNHVRSLGHHMVHLPLLWRPGFGWAPLLSSLPWSLRCWTPFGIMTFLPAFVAHAVVVNGATWLTSLHSDGQPINIIIECLVLDMCISRALR